VRLHPAGMNELERAPVFLGRPGIEEAYRVSRSMWARAHVLGGLAIVGVVGWRRRRATNGMTGVGMRLGDQRLVCLHDQLSTRL
jgi:hypothetical protein